MATVESSTIEGVRIISLNRPGRHNAIDDVMFEDMEAAWSEAIEDDASRAILIRGEAGTGKSRTGVCG